ncbi:DUF262 domain-containing protein [Arthrobacter sp. NPDC056493]|uniref:DUF262 domain-containing protein n=1 Tax=Arthrobacter sp. NPDC056493 TaxID=3345839 RepID=UPI00366B8056
MDLNRSELELESIVRRIVDGELDLQPDFQRGEIWDIRRQQRLIDTILRKWYVPAVHIVQSEDGIEIVLDGQQRLAAIRDFFIGKFRIDGFTQPATPEIEKLHGLNFSQLPEVNRRALNRFALPVVTLKNFSPQEPNELFFRLNQSYNLTPSEKRNALHGPARDQVKHLVATLEAEGLLRREVVGFSNGRLAFDDIIARTCLAIERGDLTQHINNNVVEAFYRGDKFSDQTVRGVEDSGRRLLGLIGASLDRIRFNKATLFTWLVFCYWRPRLGGQELPPELLASFEADRSALKRGVEGDFFDPRDPILGAVALYDDRASYRVTDVSSVLARDLVLQLYSEHRYGVQSICGSGMLLTTLQRGFRDDAQHLIFQHLDSSDWSLVLRRSKEAGAR